MAASSPIVQATLQAAFLSATSNVIAQVLQSYRTNTAFQLDTGPILNFVIFSILSTPPNFLWQEYLEDRFPGYSVVPAIVASEKPSASSGKKSEIVPAAKLNLRNTAIKFSLDQTIGTLINTILFVGGMAALQGRDNAAIIEKIKNDSWPLMLAGYRLWPFVSILSFTVIPPKQRLVFGSLVGVAWGIFLSMFAGR